MEIMLSHLGVGMAYDALDGLDIHAQRLHRAPFSAPPVGGVFLLALSSWTVSLRPAALPSWPWLPGSPPAPPHARQDISSYTLRPYTRQRRGGSWRTAPRLPSARRLRTGQPPSAGAQALLYINDQIDTARGSRRRNRLLRERTLPGDNGLDVLGIVAVPEGRCPQPCRPLLPRNEKRNYTAAPMLDREAGRLHEPKKSVKVCGAFGKSFIDGKP